MKIKIFATVIFSIILVTACQNKDDKQNILNETKLNESNLNQINFTLARNYFVNNTVTDSDIRYLKVNNKEKFDTFFGMATKMGEDGKPTQIDFNNEYVIAVIMPETNLPTIITPISFERSDDNKLVLSYIIKTNDNQEQTFTTRPFFMLIINNLEQGELIFKEII